MMLWHSQLFSTFISLSRSSLNLPGYYGGGTFDVLSADGFDGDIVVGGSVIAFVDFSVLSGSDFAAEYVVVNEFGHIFIMTTYG